MAMVDADGRLWGRINLLDAILLVLLVAVLPLVYGAYVLFRTPAPVLTAVEPVSLVAGDNLRVTVRGLNLRPFLRVSFDTIQGVNFLFDDSTRAQVELNPMPPGVYDIVLYDYKQERSRLPKALTILPMPKPLPATEVVVVGRFVNLTPEQAAQLTAGMRLPGGGEVLEVGKAGPAAPKVYAGGSTIDLPTPKVLQLAATLKLGCDLRAPSGYPECYGANFPFRPTYMGPVATPLGDLAFQVDQLGGAQPFEQVNVTVRFTGTSAMLAQIRPGDVDAVVADNELAAGAKVISAGPQRRISDDAAEQQAVLAIRSQRTAAGWLYVTTPLRAGSSFSFRTPRYEIGGTIVAIAPARQAEASAPK